MNSTETNVCIFSRVNVRRPKDLAVGRCFVEQSNECLPMLAVTILTQIYLIRQKSQLDKSINRRMENTITDFFSKNKNLETPY